MALKKQKQDKAVNSMNQQVILPPFLGRYKSESHSVLIKLLVKPGAKLNNITTSVDQLLSCDEIGVQIAAPPRDGEANDEVCEYMASVLALKKRNVFLQSGQKARNKQVCVQFEEATCDAKKVDDIFQKNAQYIIDKLLAACIS